MGSHLNTFWAPTWANELPFKQTGSHSSKQAPTQTNRIHLNKWAPTQTNKIPLKQRGSHWNHSNKWAPTQTSGLPLKQIGSHLNELAPTQTNKAPTQINRFPLKQTGSHSNKQVPTWTNRFPLKQISSQLNRWALTYTKGLPQLVGGWVLLQCNGLHSHFIQQCIYSFLSSHPNSLWDFILEASILLFIF